MPDLPGALLAGLASFAEAMLGVGFVLPGEVTVAALAAAAGSGQLPWMWLLVLLGALAGDQVNYWLGRSLGGRLEGSRLVERLGRGHWQRGVALIARYGALAIVLSRVLPVVRTLVPAVAGTGRMPWRRFAPASFVGCAAWAAVWVGAGGALALVARWSLPVLGVLALAGVGLWVGRRVRRRRERRHALVQDRVPDVAPAPAPCG
ncbi:DedA family protein [Nocardioides sambongensis]|uniref:DedA family protein n=1 Tax=Nocardioides sambongensis TaxID=2589074 RepID=UPI001128A073|nr:VTT domain-containing protein [Nocardioides sambongensis]